MDTQHRLIVGWLNGEIEVIGELVEEVYTLREDIVFFTTMSSALDDKPLRYERYTPTIWVSALVPGRLHGGAATGNTGRSNNPRRFHAPAATCTTDRSQTAGPEFKVTRLSA